MSTTPEQLLRDLPCACDTWYCPRHELARRLARPAVTRPPVLAADAPLASSREGRADRYFRTEDDLELEPPF